MRCGKCGNTEFSLVSMKGKTFPWKDFPLVFVIVDDLFLHECSKCDEVLISARKGEVEKVDQALKTSVKDQAVIFLNEIKRRGISQKELCDEIRVTPQHLSNIKSGVKEPSFQLFSMLKLLAENPDLIKNIDPKYVPSFLKKAVGQ